MCGSECERCATRCAGFMTDREQRKVMGCGVLYLLGFPILILMVVVGALKAVPPGDGNPNCPAEPNMPWFLITGGAGISLLLLVRIALNKCTRCVKNSQQCCDQVTGCFCEFGCNLVYDCVVMAFIVLWLVTVTWWVARHMIGPDALYSVLDQDGLDSFRASLGDNDTIHQVQWTDPGEEDYCDQLLYLVTFVLLVLGWLVLLVSLTVFLADKILNKLVCCKLCSSMQRDRAGTGRDEENVKLSDNSRDRIIEY